MLTPKYIFVPKRCCPQHMFDTLPYLQNILFTGNCSPQNLLTPKNVDSKKCLIRK